MGDISFEALGERFEKNIYGSVKGALRERILHAQIEKHYPLHVGPARRCADIGGGLGQMSHWLAAQGHSVRYCDLSETMTARARQAYPSQSPGHIEFECGAFQTLFEHERFELVHCQAVLEWLEQPFEGLAKMADMVEPGGALILSFYNRDSLILRNLIRGNLNAAFEQTRGDGSGLTPIHPLDINEVLSAIEQHGFTLRHWFGIRCFTDYQSREVQQRLGTEALLPFELELSDREPYRRLARYIGIIATKSE